MSAPAAQWRSPLLSGALPPAKRHGSEPRPGGGWPGVNPTSPTSALATIAPVCHHLLLSCSDNACGARNDPAIALCAMPRHQTHAGRTQGIPLSAAGVWEPLCGRVREHGRVIVTYICHARCHRRHATSWSRRVRGARAATTTTAVAGRVPVVGRVPSGPLGGRTGTAGPADCDSTFMCELLAQRATRRSPHTRATARPCGCQSRRLPAIPHGTGIGGELARTRHAALRPRRDVCALGREGLPRT